MTKWRLENYSHRLRGKQTIKDFSSPRETLGMDRETSLVASNSITTGAEALSIVSDCGNERKFKQ